MEIVEYDDRYKNEIIELILTIQNKEAKIGLSIEEQPDLSDIRSAYELNGGKFWIAVEKQRVIGTIALMISENHCGILKKFFVKAEYRGQKIGAALYRVLLEYAKAKDLKYIVLDTPSVATVSHGFYERAGFKKITREELPVFYEYPDRNSYLYLLTLKSVAG